jgi:hypothetical protein
LRSGIATYAAAEGFKVVEREADHVLSPSSKLSSAQSSNRVVGAIGGVILASGVVGTLISFYLQGRSWEYQTRSAKIERDSAAVLSVLEGVDKLIDEKWLSTYELNDAIKTQLEGEKLDAAVRRFYAANKDWELRHNILASNLRIAVDSQFGIDDRNMNVSTIDCQTYTLTGLQPNGSDPLPVGALLEIAYNCHNAIKGKIDEQLRANEQNNSVWPATAAEPDPGGLALSHIWWVDKVLQCMMVGRSSFVNSLRKCRSCRSQRLRIRTPIRRMSASGRARSNVRSRTRTTPPSDWRRSKRIDTPGSEAPHRARREPT